MLPLVLSSDSHVFEPPDLWQRYIDPAYRHAAPIGLTEMRRDMRVKVKSHIILRQGAVRPVNVPGSLKENASVSDSILRAASFAN